MPAIAAFLGIVIRMYFQQAEHNPPHVHASYGDDAAAVAIRGGEVLDGRLPDRQLRLVQEWVSMHEEELPQMWQTQRFHKVRPLG